MKKIRFFAASGIVLALGLAATSFAGSAHSRAQSNGGIARSHAEGRGEARVSSTAGANGGEADSTARGHGNVDVLSTAITTQGYSRSNASGFANQGSRGTSEAMAASVGGTAYAVDSVSALDGGVADSNTTAIADGGMALGRGSSKARGTGHSLNNSYAESHRGTAISDGASHAVGRGGGRADSRTDVASFAGPGRAAHANATSDAQAYDGGRSSSEATFFDIR